MKKFLAILLMLTLLCTSFVACNGNEGEVTDVQSYPEQDAIDYIKAMYKKEAEVTAADFTRVSVVAIDGVPYKVVWTANVTAGTDPVNIVENADGVTVTIDVPEKATAEVAYTLTATITDYYGNSVSASFNHKVPPYAVMSYAEYAAAADDTSLVVSGVISGIFSKTNGSSGNGMYIQDVKGEGGYYVYGFADGKDPEADFGLKVGMSVIVTGVKDTYNGLYEIINASVEITNSELTKVEPIDYTEIYKSAESLSVEALAGKQSMLVTLKGVEITTQEEANGYFKFKLADKEAYIRISSSNNCITKDEITAFKAAHTENFGNTADVTGIIQLYNGNFYLIPADANALANFKKVEKTDAEKVATEADNLTFQSSIANNGEYALAQTGANYSDVKITWKSDNAAAVVTGDKLVVTLPKADEVVKLTATLTCGKETATKTIEVKLYAGAKSYADIVDMAYALADGSALDGTYRLYGVITKIDTAWSDQYNNITVTIQIGDKADKLIMCYRLKGDGAKDLKVGDAITVEGKLKNYKGTIEFDAGCILVGMGEVIAPETIVENAYKLEDGKALEGTYTLTGVITKVDTAWSEQYGNITVTIQVGDLTDKLIMCYRLKGDGANALKVGDKITVTGAIKNYKGTIEFDAGCTLDAVDAVQTPTQPETPATPAALEATKPAAGTAYKFGFVQGNAKKTLYITGKMDGYYMGTTEDKAAAIDVFVEETTGGFYLYFTLDGAKTYVNMVKSGNYTNAKYEAAASTVYTYDETLKTFVASVEGSSYIFGTKADGTYTTLGPMAADSGCFHGVFVK
ncbi:MAG: hypothetical protein J6S14_02840 [Clostridia bacterium]|nr:hypothetical protein [Clostridia bacterium]